MTTVSPGDRDLAAAELRKLAQELGRLCNTMPWDYVAGLGWAAGMATERAQKWEKRGRKLEKKRAGGGDSGN